MLSNALSADLTINLILMEGKEGFQHVSGEMKVQVVKTIFWPMRKCPLFLVGIMNTNSSLTDMEKVLLAVTGFFGVVITTLAVTVVILGLMLYKKNSELSFL